MAEHGGRIGFESTEGAGTSFWFELPSAISAGSSAPGARVLVVADDSALTRLLAESLALDGLQIESAPTGVSGLEQALALPPAAICLDIDLCGDLDGWQVLVRLKANPMTARIPVVVCSSENRRETAATLGAADFVAKPFIAEQLYEAVARQLAAERTSVLVVGRDDALRRLIIETLARDGGELREAADALEALTMIATRRPDALVFDLSQAALDGFAELQQLLDRPETRGRPVVVLTGRELSDSERSFLAERNASLLEKRAYSGDQLRRLVRHTPLTSLTAALLGSYDIPIGAVTTQDLLARAPGRVSPLSQPQPIAPLRPSTRRRDPVPIDETSELDGAAALGQLADISTAMKRVYTEQFGREPGRTHSHYIGTDAIACFLRGTLTAAERRLTTLDEHQRLRDMRMLFQYTAEDEFRLAVEEITGRTVIAFISGIDTKSDIASEIFMLEPA